MNNHSSLKNNKFPVSPIPNEVPMDDQIVYRFSHKPDEEVRFSIHEYRGSIYVDVRTFFQPKDGDEMKATRKGLTLRRDFFDELKKGILACEKTVSKLEPVKV